MVNCFRPWMNILFCRGCLCAAVLYLWLSPSGHEVRQLKFHVMKEQIVHFYIVHQANSWSWLTNKIHISAMEYVLIAMFWHSVASSLMLPLLPISQYWLFLKSLALMKCRIISGGSIKHSKLRQILLQSLIKDDFKVKDITFSKCPIVHKFLTATDPWGALCNTLP